jgi:hypothetical protein
MRNGIAVVVLLAATAAWAQASDAPLKPGEEPAPPAEEKPPAQTGQEGTPERPSEDAIFGREPPPASATQETRPTPTDEESQRLAPGIRDRFAGEEEVEDPLDIGGLFYQRLAGTNRQSTHLEDTTLSAPTLVDVYLDARPNDRLRAMVLARLQYDPTLGAQAANPLLGEASGGDTTSTGSTSSALLSLLGQPRDNPSVVLDQLWLRFDILRTVFVTAGKQHVKWGAARFWTPTDYLHPVRRDALALFDVRTGANMVKLHLPIEQTGSNVYAIALFDNVGTANALREVGGAFRAETALGNAEIGVDAVLLRGQRPRYGFDFSSAVGPFDVYGEAGLRAGPYSRWVRTVGEPLLGTPTYTFTRQRQPGKNTVAATGGLNWTFAYTENDTATIGAEYFYNPSGYTDPNVYPWLLFTGDFQPFYTGRHYVGAYALLPGPGTWDKANFVLSTLGNVSDRSFVSRLDFTIRVLTHLTVEATTSVFFGEEHGEFRLGLDVPESFVNGDHIPALNVPAQRLQVGLGLRMEI